VAPAHRRFEQDYQLTGETLGSGMSGDVSLARPRHGGGAVAVKTLSKVGLSAKQTRLLQKEVNIYLDMDHAHIAQLLQVYDEADKVYLVMEHCSGGSLMSRLEEKGCFTEREAAAAAQDSLALIQTSVRTQADACTCLSWHDAYKAHNQKCGQGREMYLVGRSMGPMTAMLPNMHFEFCQQYFYNLPADKI